MDSKDKALAAAIRRDDRDEDKGMHGDDRKTCYQCQSWADHAHDPNSNVRITDEEYRAIKKRRGF